MHSAPSEIFSQPFIVLNVPTASCTFLLPPAHLPVSGFSPVMAGRSVHAHARQMTATVNVYRAHVLTPRACHQVIYSCLPAPLFLSLTLGVDFRVLPTCIHRVKSPLYIAEPPVPIPKTKLHGDIFLKCCSKTLEFSAPCHLFLLSLRTSYNHIYTHEHSIIPDLQSVQEMSLVANYYSNFHHCCLI